MEWRIDTSTTGEVPVAELRKALEASRDHWIETQAAAAGKAVMHAATANHGKSGELELDLATLTEAAAKADEAAQTHKAKSAELAEHMQAGIDAACKLADIFGGIVTATIVGHDDERHPSACAKRMSVAVDQTWK